MTTVTGLTADRMLAIEAASVIDGDVDTNGNLILTKHDGSQINAGSVIGPAGPQGPIGNMLPVLNAAGILDVGLSNQIRAGRQLSPADFAAIGLNAPIGLWNLSDLSDASGNGRALSNKGAVPFTSGINGVATTAAQFVGSTAQALYIPDTGAADPFRIKTGSFGCWFRTSKRGAGQTLISKWLSPQLAWNLMINSTNTLLVYTSVIGTDFVGASGFLDVCDDRWHFAVATNDGALLKIYVDGLLETAVFAPVIFSGSAVLNIGSYGADGATVAANQHFGRVDEAFVTADVLSDDQVRNLYCAKIPHTLGVVPVRTTLNVRRRKKGPALAVADFPTQPLRLYNFSAASLGDQGSNNQGLVSNPSTGSIVAVAGVDGSSNNAFSFSGAHQGLSATDTGLPAGVTTRSLGCWFKTTATGSVVLLFYGTTPGNHCEIWVSGSISSVCGGTSATGPYVADGLWHLMTLVVDNTVTDAEPLKLYVDGRLVAFSASIGSTTLKGANGFRIGVETATVGPFAGQIDGVFVCDYALTAAQIAALYAKGAQALSPSPKNVGDHVEGMDAANLYATFDVLDSQNQIDLAVA